MGASGHPDPTGRTPDPTGGADPSGEDVEVYADVACPFTHVGLARFRAYRQSLGRDAPRLRVRSWPLELVNGAPLDAAALAPKVAALRTEVAPDLFGGFARRPFPTSTLAALASEQAAYRRGSEVGEGFAFRVRHALFEEGLDVGDEDVMARLRAEWGVDEPSEGDRAAVLRDHQEGQAKGVTGSPHFFTSRGDFFCPSLKIEHDEHGLDVSFDAMGFERFVATIFGSSI